MAKMYGTIWRPENRLKDLDFFWIKHFCAAEAIHDYEKKKN